MRVIFPAGCVAPHPPIAEALKRYKDKLVAAGHDVIEWHPLDHQKAWDLIVSDDLVEARLCADQFTDKAVSIGRRCGIPRNFRGVWRTSGTADRMDLTACKGARAIHNR